MSEMVERVGAAFSDERRLWYVRWSSLEKRAEVCRAKDLLALDGAYSTHAIFSNRDQADAQCDRMSLDSAARAAIQAMREPTEKMAEIGSLAYPDYAKYKGEEERDIWRAMIDEALK